MNAESGERASEEANEVSGGAPGDEPVTGDAWNPGLESDIPRRLKPLVTLFRPGNGTVSFAEAEELADLTGLDPVELACFTPERLIVHELLVRVTADLSVPDGPNYEDLGISLRGMAGVLFERHVAPELEAIREAFERERERARGCIEAELATLSPDADPDAAEDPPPESALGRLWSSLFSRGKARKGRTPAAGPASGEPPELAAMARWRDELGGGRGGHGAHAAGSEPGKAGEGVELELRRACLQALLRTVGAVVAHRGRLFADSELLGRVALGLAMNARGAALINELVAPLVASGIEREGYRLLPPREAPVVMNVKGASAAGKSTIRPCQRELAGKLGIPWEDFALISPDYWRKHLLDYASLGEDFRYGAMLTGRELEIVDRKLDAYMAAKAERGEISHLLIDRFRFDSFTIEQDRAGDTRLLTRFGQRVFMFFMVTPPAETVERAWARGRKTGRFKAVSDLLYHNVEAFAGMPALFLSWVNTEDREVRFEFLDNDVPEGTLPRTAAFGWNGSMTVLDVPLLLAIDRFRKVDVEARRAEDVLREPELSKGERAEFVRRCAAKVSELRFADRETAQVYARVVDGKLLWWDRDYLAGESVPEEIGMVLDVLGRDADVDPGADPSPRDVVDIERERHFTVGSWGPAVVS